ncbi:TMEM175 family protein [Arthrobacter sp. A5]|uniref:TMEM175 family protein n=1 Tax=Arthrobacter sp. A5 TaxID=576926 RepID=UPI003DA885E7
MVNFCDAVVAIAITLLILPLVDAASNIGTLSVGELFAQNAFLLFVFVLSFAVIGNFWLVHHRLYEQVIDYNVPLLWANLLWLLTIVFLPFPTELLGSGDRRDLATYAVYIGTLVLTSAAILLQQVIVVRSADLHAPGNQRPPSLRPYVITTILLILAFAVAVTIRGIGLWSLLLLAVGRPLERLLQELQRPH